MTSKSQTESVKTVKLTEPYTFGDKKITELVIKRRPKAKDLKGLALGKGLTDDQFKLLGRISNLSTPEIEEMSMGDVMLCIQSLDSFLPESLRTGISS